MKDHKFDAERHTVVVVKGIGGLQPKYEYLVPAIVPLGSVGIHFLSVSKEPYVTYTQNEQLHQQRLCDEVFGAPPPEMRLPLIGCRRRPRRERVAAGRPDVPRNIVSARGCNTYNSLLLAYVGAITRAERRPPHAKGARVRFDNGSPTNVGCIDRSIGESGVIVPSPPAMAP